MRNLFSNQRRQYVVWGSQGFFVAVFMATSVVLCHSAAVANDTGHQQARTERARTTLLERDTKTEVKTAWVWPFNSCRTNCYRPVTYTRPINYVRPTAVYRPVASPCAPCQPVYTSTPCSTGGCPQVPCGSAGCGNPALNGGFYGASYGNYPVPLTQPVSQPAWTAPGAVPVSNPGTISYPAAPVNSIVTPACPGCGGFHSPQQHWNGGGQNWGTSAPGNPVAVPMRSPQVVPVSVPVQPAPQYFVPTTPNVPYWTGEKTNSDRNADQRPSAPTRPTRATRSVTRRDSQPVMFGRNGQNQRNATPFYP